MQTGEQSFLRNSRPRDGRVNIRLQLILVVRRCSCNVLLRLRPNKFCRVEFGSCHRKLKYDKALMCLNEFLYNLAFVDGMPIPNQDNETTHKAKQLFEKSDHLFTGQAIPIRLDGQSDFLALGRNQQSAQNVETVVMINTRSNHRRLPAPRPSAFERRNQREACFIFKRQRGVQLANLFLPLAIPSAAKPSPPLRLCAKGDAVVAGCSIPADPRGAISHWDGNAP